MTVLIREETADDHAAIEALTIAAFLRAAHTSHTEQFIVRALRAAGHLSVSLVAQDDATLIGHAAASPVRLSCGEAGWFGLGPVSVVPTRQGRGIGGRLVAGVLDRLRALGASGCVVLGEPGYYARFGFRAERALSLPGVAPEYFQAVAFSRGVPAGTVSYAEAFSARS